MVSDRLASSLAARGVHYGWVVAGVAFLTSLTTAGAVGLPGAFILPLSKEFGWDAAQISGALAIRFALFGLMAPFAAALIGRYGMRRMMLLALALVSISFLGALAMTELWHFVALWGVVIGVGTGLTALVLGATLANRWFVERRGLVLGMMAAATATGQLVFLPLAAMLIESHGWRAALIPSIVAFGLVALLVALFMRERPADLGLPAYGATQIEPAPTLTGSPAAAAARAFGILGEASHSPTFWILFATFFVCGLSTNGLVQTHFIPLCADYGIGPVQAASTLAIMGLFDVVGTVGSGWLSDRYDNRWLLFWYYGLRGLSLLWLPFSGFSVFGLSIFAVFYGLDWIATVPPTARLSGASFGPEKAPIVFGWIFAGHQIGAAIAAFGGGASRTAFLSYLPAFALAGAACLIAAGLIVLMRDIRKPQAAPA
jgi:MFS family permease